MAKPLKTIEEIRRNRLLELIDKYGGNKELAAVLKRAPAQISHWKTAAKDMSSPHERPRTISSDTCRYIEKTLGLEHGWMDNPADSISALTPDQVKLACQIAALPKEEQVKIQHHVEFELATMPCASEACAHAPSKPIQIGSASEKVA